jgi:Undecaprenyl-phosphate galactose phosphotransferase WbaP
MQNTIEAEVKAAAYIKPRPFSTFTLFQQHARGWMTLSLAVSDLLSLSLAVALAVLLRMSLGDFLQSPENYIHNAPFLLIFLLMYTLRGLYPAVGLSPVEEFRRLIVTTSTVFLMVTAFTFWVRTAGIYSRLVFAFAWIFALVFVQLGRWLTRLLMVRLGLWGEPVAIVGYGPQGQRITEFLLGNLRFGLRPVVIIDGFDDYENKEFPIPRIQNHKSINPANSFRNDSIKTAILIVSEMPKQLQMEVVNEQRFGFKRLILISDLSWIGSVGVVPYDLEGFLGLEVRQNLFSNWQQIAKRVLDISLILVFSPFLLPLIGLISLAIRLDSKDSVFFCHKRVGMNGKEIKVWKFRTMVRDADEKLSEYLAIHPELSAEWEATQKLKNDPRVTRVGSFLRKSSLDELPQIWNVLKGEMSLVGPRPIIEDEIRHYRHVFRLYTRVMPGLTGLWQVSGRNDVGYEMRVRFDEFYVRNWSIWLDLYILLRTIGVVIKRDGAY